ncbi:hypothetical protein FE374_03730 [Georgenia yuyongxinii]|uniref:Uncharacterized protein n=1 Tax=Georgenia yuyongxinii TaxID=2589797 RepID=A0A5B8C1E5_9MICO|nr:hypothetical protein [Georgenia yuyongxinii]QDC23860.1 hypothetical protein FE374_03730 [Georgenia yuyongxinii]
MTRAEVMGFVRSRVGVVNGDCSRLDHIVVTLVAGRYEIRDHVSSINDPFHEALAGRGHPLGGRHAWGLAGGLAKHRMRAESTTLRPA